MIPQCNPYASFLRRRGEIEAAVDRVLESGRYILGKEVAALEKEFAEYLGVAHTVGVATGTDAIEFALRALGVGGGDTVITVSHTAVATVSAISRVGATPLFVDIGADYLMSPESLEGLARSVRKKGVRPKALVVVHLYGRMADMQRIVQIAREYDLSIIEDCAQAHGAALLGRRAGCWGDAGCFSFYPTKNLGAFGDAGAVVTSRDDVADRVRSLRQYGWRTRYVSDEIGFNSRLDEVQAAVLRVKLKTLDEDNDRRRAVAARYRAGLSGSPIELPSESGGGTHVYHQFVIQAANRDLLADKLTSREIGTGVHYPLAVHQQAPYRSQEYRVSDLRMTERAAARVLSLPMFPELTEESVDLVVHALLSALTA